MNRPPSLLFFESYFMEKPVNCEFYFTSLSLFFLVKWDRRLRNPCQDVQLPHFLCTLHLLCIWRRSLPCSFLGLKNSKCTVGNIDREMLWLAFPWWILDSATGSWFHLLRNLELTNFPSYPIESHCIYNWFKTSCQTGVVNDHQNVHIYNYWLPLHLCTSIATWTISWECRQRTKEKSSCSLLMCQTQYNKDVGEIAYFIENFSIKMP